MDDTQRRAQAFNANELTQRLDERIALLEDELARVIAQFRSALDDYEELIAEVTKVLAMPPDVKQASEEAHATMRACLDVAEATLGPGYEKRRRGILQQMHDDAVRTGLDKALDVTPDDVVALQNKERSKKTRQARGMARIPSQHGSHSEPSKTNPPKKKRKEP